MTIKSDTPFIKAEINGEIRFTDVFNTIEIQRLQDLLSNATGVSSVIADLNGIPLTRPSNFSRLCKDIILNTAEGLSSCISCNAVSEVPEDRSPLISHCFICGLWEAAVPVVLGGHHIANWFIGQVRNEDLNRQLISSYADKIGVDREEFFQAYVEVPVMTKEQFLKVAEMVTENISLLSDNAFKNFELKQQIDEREKATLLLKESEARFRNLLHDVHSVSVQGYGPDGTTLYWNKASEHLYGYTAEEALGRNLFDLIIPQEMKELVKKSILQMEITGEAIPSSELTLIRKDGSLVNVFSSHTIVQKPGQPLEFFCIDIDLTNLKVAEKALAESNLLLETIINSIPMRIFWKDKESRYMGCNPPFAKDAGKPDTSKLIGKDDYEMNWKEQAPLYRADDKLVMSSEKGKIFYEEPQSSPDGRQIVLKTSKVPLKNKEGEVIGVLGIYDDITEQKLSEVALRESEEKYRLLIENANEAIYVIQNEIIVFGNNVCEEVSGMPLNDLIGLSILMFVDPEARPDLAHYIDAITTGTITGQKREFSFRRNNGDKRWLSVSSVRIEWNGMPAVLNLGTDVTDQKYADELLRISEEKYRSIFENVQDVFFQTNLDGVIIEASPSVRNYVGYQEDELIGTSVYNLYANPQERELILGIIQKEGAIRDHELRLITKSGEIRYMILNARLIFDKHGNPGHFNGALRDITGRKLAEDSLRESEAKFRSIAEQSNDLIVITDHSGIIEYISPASFEIYQYTPEEMVGTGFTEYLQESDIPKALEAFKKGVEFKVNQKNLELYMKRKDGSVFIGELNGTSYEYGNQSGLLVVIRDITERRQAEGKLRESEEKYRLLLENSGIGVGVFGLDGTVQLFNQKAIQNMGGEAKDYIGKKLSEIFGEVAGSVYQERINKTAECETSLEFEDNVTLGSGSYWFLSNHSRIKNQDGEIIGVQVLSHDITERKKAEETLVNERLLIRTLIDNIPDSIYSKDLNCRKTLANTAELNYLGAESESVVLGKDDFAFYPKEIAEKFLADDLKVMETGKPVLNKEEYIYDESGNKRWLLSSKLPLRDKNNRITGLVGIGRDITDRMKAEQSMRESEEKYRLLFQHLTVGFALHEIILNSDGKPCDYRFLQINSAFEKMTGLKAGDLIGKTALEVLPGTESFWIETYGKVALTGKPVNFEHLSHALNKYYQVNSYSPEPGKFAAVFLDITERKLAEEALRFSEEKYRILIENANEAIYVVQNKQIVFANKVCEEISGIGHEELTGISILDLVDPRDQEELIRHHRGIIEENQQSPNSLFSIRNLKNEKRWLSVNSVRIIWNGMPATLNMATDITDQKLMDEQLRKSEEKYRAIFENVQDVFYQTDLDGLIKEISPSIKHFSQFEKDDLLGTLVSDIYADPTERHLLIEALIKKGELRDHELKIRTKAGEIVYASINARLIADEYGQPSHIDGALRDITGRKLAEEALQKSYDLLNNLTAMVPGVVYQYRLYPDGHSCFPVSSRGMYDIYEVTPEEVRTDASVVFSRIHPDDIDSITESILASARNQTIYHSDYRVILPEQGLRWRHCDARPQLMDDGSTLWYGIISDITESKLADEAMIKFQTAIENSNTSIVITDSNGIIEYANPFFTQITGYTKEDFIGKKTGILKSGFHSNAFYHDLWKTIKSGATWEGEFYNKKKNGQLFWENAIISPIRNVNNVITHFVTIKSDITSSKKINEELIIAKNQSEESDRLKSAFLANMSHEIRTPMNGILGFTELLKTPGVTGEEQKEYIRIIRKSGERMLNIINDIVDISKIESGQMKISLSNTNVNEVTEYIYNFFKPEVENKGLRISYRNGLPADKAIIKTDHEKIYAILTNLVKNAIKFTGSGFIDFGYSKLESNLEFFVKDSGNGIPLEHQAFIFERFRQGSESLSRNYEGAGLGLSISRAYVELLGGKIRLESEPGKGSAFYFTIPYVVEKENIISIKNIVPLNETPPKVKNLKVLIVEDDDISDMFLTIAIRMVSNEVLHAVTGPDAIKICRENPDLDLILMDIKIPEMDGHETTRQIRKFNKNVIVIAQTAHGMADDKKKALEAGCDDYISKPINQYRLVEMIRSHLHNRRINQ